MRNNDRSVPRDADRDRSSRSRPSRSWNTPVRDSGVSGSAPLSCRPSGSGGDPHVGGGLAAQLQGRGALYVHGLHTQVLRV